jgi:hypothetical protein
MRPRSVRIVEGIEYDGSYGSHRTETIVPDPDGDLLTSHISEGFHLPVFDIDWPATLVPSKTPEHFHLVIDRPITWRRYKRLVKAMVKAGIVEQSWYDLVKRRGQGLLRKPA